MFKKIGIGIGIFFVLFFVGCKQKTYFSIVFDQFTMNIYDNKKQYTTELLPGTILAYKQKSLPGFTGFTNSLIVIKQPIQSGGDLKTLITLNTKTNQTKLLKYKTLKTTPKKITCKKIQYPGYINTFSYQLLNQTIYGGQYFVVDNDILYIVSLNSESLQDIEYFVKSINTITCQS